ncbi:MAG: T9SS type A sorting domain-containing protein [Fidelibacterota bacterium]|nr:MAG: T9SS type A sorting domain-containing protein [Candidatus Neomarinimicrobiota bacterium]
MNIHFSRLYRLVMQASCAVLFSIALEGIALGDETKWIAIGDLHNWYSSAGSEREVGRRGEMADQQDGLRWPAQYASQDVQVAKALWIGAINFYDANVNTTLDYKVVHVGPRVLDDVNEMMPQEFKLYGRRHHPYVLVDGNPGSNLMNGMDEVDEIDANLAADRMLYNLVNTAMGITVTRKIHAFSNPYRQNYHIYEYIFKNTGLIDNQGTVYSQTIEDVVIFFQYRYAPTREACIYEGAYLPQSATWGHSTVNDAVSIHPVTTEPFRAQFAWLGRHSQAGFSTIGGPAASGDGHLAAAQYVGVITLHADVSPTDPTDDPTQPLTTMYINSDLDITLANSQFDTAKMAAEYAYMISGHPANTHAVDMSCPTPIDCNGYANTYIRSGDPGNMGGYSGGQGFGPYTLAPGDSICIILAEAVAGIDCQMRLEVGRNWLEGNSPFALPDAAGRTYSGGGPTDDADFYKNVWVYTGEDSLFQAFERASRDYSSGYDVPVPPPPPDSFFVNSSDEEIRLRWVYKGDLPAEISGFRLFRAVQHPDTAYDEIFACGDGSPIVTEFVDASAVRGLNYYYYVIAFDDGSGNDIEPGVALTSSKFWTMTSIPAYLHTVASTKVSVATPRGFTLLQNYPNPFNPETKLPFFLPAATEIRLSVYDLLGREIVRLVDGYMEQGDHQVIWDGRTDGAIEVPTGMYIARLISTVHTRSIKMVIIR